MTLEKFEKDLQEKLDLMSDEELRASLEKAGCEFYKPNTFFSFPQNKKEFLEDCMAVADRTWVDELNCSKSFARQPTDKTPVEVLELGLKTKSHYTFIFRDGYGQPDYFETGLSTIGNTPDYFLWINLSVEQGLKMIEKWGLKERKIS